MTKIASSVCSAIVLLFAVGTSASIASGQTNNGTQNDPNFPPAYNAWTVDSILFGDNPQRALQGLTPAAGSPFEIAGKNASVQRGVLTFTLADGTMSKPYSVARPGFMASAPQTTGIAGTWIAMQDGGKGIMFNVQANKTVTGKEISSQVVQMLMQRAPKLQ